MCFSKVIQANYNGKKFERKLIEKYSYHIFLEGIFRLTELFDFLFYLYLPFSVYRWGMGILKVERKKYNWGPFGFIEFPMIYLFVVLPNCSLVSQIIISVFHCSDRIFILTDSNKSNQPVEKSPYSAQKAFWIYS